ncbi:HNH/ENDO VII family nuclease, partial [Streptomyces sp. NPDC057543]|uniref:HNH/ENDO VII family nuclease n=1 Tax=Streptomyces sp. NPDC057543 TaxID=3346163 RepID=UPI00368238CD
IGSLANKVKSVFHAVAKPVNRAIDKIVGFITKAGKKLWAKINKKDPRKGGAADAKDDKNSISVKREARDLLATPTSKTLSDKAALHDLIERIHNQLKPKGLKSLRAQFKNDNSGKFSVVAKASPGSVVAHGVVGNPNNIKEIEKQLNKHGPDFIEKVHNEWWSRQFNKPESGGGKIWPDKSILLGTETLALSYFKDSVTHKFIEKEYYANGANPTLPQFYVNVFGNNEPVRKEAVGLLGGGALATLRKVGLSNTAGEIDTQKIIRKMRFLSNEDTYGRYAPFPETGTDSRYIRVTLWESTKVAIKASATKTPNGKYYIDPNIGVLIPVGGPFHYGHKPGYEYWRSRDRAKAEEWTREEFIKYENIPSHYWIEDPDSNMSHEHEAP